MYSYRINTWFEARSLPNRFLDGIGKWMAEAKLLKGGIRKQGNQSQLFLYVYKNRVVASSTSREPFSMIIL
tara:strand:+ start:176 stop:388 length:213 start_codon:yes stop_codon:yes gene_type:complete